MKKVTLFLVMIIAVCLFGVVSTNFDKVKADETNIASSNTVETQIVLPSSYLEYFSLNSPVDVCYDGVSFVIAENKRIVAYIDGMWKTFELAEYSVSKIALYENFCLFLSSSELFYFSLNDGMVKKCSVIISNYFYINGNQLVTNPSTSIYRYTIKSENGELNFVEPTIYNGLNFSVDKFVITEDGNLYYFLEQKLYHFNYADRTSTEIGKNLLATPRYTTTSNGIIYYSSETGIYSFNFQTKLNQIIMYTANGDTLPVVVNPQGINFYNGMLLIADSNLNSILSIDTESNKFTDFAVTTRSDMPNRINNANDITSYEKNLFILESNAIKSYNTEQGTSYEYSLANFSGARYIAVTSKYIFLSQGAQLYVVEYDGENLEQVSLDSSVDIDEYKNIVAVMAFEEDFYFIDNQSRNSVMKACIYKLSTADMKITEIGTINGAGQRLCTDIFGKMYIAINTTSNFEYYSFVPAYFEETLSSAPLFTTAERPLSMFVDIEDKLYVLFDNMVLKCYEQSFDPPYNFVTNSEFSISLSLNLPNSTNIKLCELLTATNNLYLLSDNILFEVTNDLGISAPNRLRVPEDLKIELNTNPEFIKVNKASKIFKINIEDTNKEFFDYTEYTTELSGNDFIVLNRSDRYSLIFNQDTCALVRNSDVEAVSPTIVESQSQYYMVDNYGLYAYPTTRNSFKINSINKNDTVTLVKTINFNGTNYCLITSNQKQGYVPETLLKPAIATDNTPTNYYTIKIAKGGTKVYSDKELKNQIGFINGEKTLTAVESKDGVTKIYYNGGFAYISDKTIQSTTYYAVRYIIVISCLFVAILATIIYIFKVKVFDKHEQ